MIDNLYYIPNEFFAQYLNNTHIPMMLPVINSSFHAHIQRCWLDAVNQYPIFYYPILRKHVYKTESILIESHHRFIVHPSASVHGLYNLYYRRKRIYYASAPYPTTLGGPLYAKWPTTRNNKVRFP